jgi:hypothetical protein
MRLKPIVLAAGLLGGPAIALAQSAPSPNNQSGPGVSPSVQSPTDPGTGNASGNTKATPERKASVQSTMMKGSKQKAPTTGANLHETKKRNASPNSAAEGAEKVK